MIRPRHGRAIALGLVCLLSAANGQTVLPETRTAHSFSGQFVVNAVPGYSPLFHRSDLATNALILRLEPALLAVAVERFKNTLWQQLGLKSGSPWQGKIYLDLHPTRSLDDPIHIVSGPFLDNWCYRVDLPDVIERSRYTRTLATMALLEIANRHTPTTGRSAEIPPWLADGMAQQVAAIEGSKIILTAPARTIDGLPQIRTERTSQGFDPLADTRRTLQAFPALTFDQLSWPTADQLDGIDGGIYLGSAHLFVTELLALPEGRAKLRNFLAQLSSCRNWQIAFFAAFNRDFSRPLDVEKWWSLQVYAFVRQDPGPQWLLADSRDRLAELLSVPVEYRSSSNALPEHVAISLQAAIQNFEPDQRAAVLRTKARDLALAQLRLAPPFGSLADAYRTTLLDFLGDRPRTPRTWLGNKFAGNPSAGDNTGETLAHLDTLDGQRRDYDANFRSLGLPANLPAAVP